MFAVVLVSLAALVSSTLGWQPDFVLRVSNTTLYSDCQPRESIVINGTHPAPLLRMKEGEHYWIRVYNDIPDQNTTLHWHGFSQFASPFSDGTPQTSGWPIPPGRFVDYEFQLQDGFYGTYWYHSHVAMQAMMAQGPIIVEPKDQSNTPVEYDEDVIMMLSDYYHADDSTIIAGLLNTTTFGWLGEPQNLLVNGHAQDKCNSTALKPGQTCGTACGNNLQKVLPGKKYRVRVIGATVLSYIGMALEGHKMTLFEVDGTYIEPMEIEDLEIQAGQRYSILIETLPDPPKRDYYWRLRTMWRPTRMNGSALWQYDESAPTDSPFIQDGPVSQAPTPTDLNQTVFLPNETFGWVSDDFVMWNKSDYPPRDDEVTRQIILNGQQLVEGKAGFRWSVNNHTNDGSLPNIPYLVQYYSEDESERTPDYAAALQNGGFDPGSSTYPAKLGEVLDIIIQNRAGPTSGMVETHPWHAHGEKYWDMGAGVGNFSYAALNASRVASKGQPYLRDTSVAYPGPGASYNSSMIENDGLGGWRLFRIKVTDPGAWLVHCHLTPHQVMGMMSVFVYGAEELPDIPDSLVSEYLTFGGGAYGQPTYDYVPRSYFAEVEGRMYAREPVRLSKGWAVERLAGGVVYNGPERC